MDSNGRDPDRSLILYVQRFVESKMISSTTDERQAMFATVFAMMAHYVVPVNATAARLMVCMVSLWRGEVVSTSAGASRSVSSEAWSF